MQRGDQLPAAWAHLPLKNDLLAALPAADYQRVLPHLEPISLPLGWSIYEAGMRMNHVLFPTEGIVSLLYVLEDGNSTEIVVTGREGVVGLPLFMGGEAATSRAVVQSAGQGYCLPADFVMEEFERGGPLQQLLLRYAQALITQIAQTVACFRHHTVEQQFCRWLLSSLDRLPSNELHMTQELIANMLGVRRESITEAAGNLQNAGMIVYRRGHITVLNRPAMERKVCECYAVVKREYARLQAKPMPSAPGRKAGR